VPSVGAAPTPAGACATRALVPLFAVTLFLSSFLMFTVEPMVARQMLPVLGGVPMVWNGCVVFFQAVLLAGYGGAHVLTRASRRRCGCSLCGLRCCRCCSCGWAWTRRRHAARRRRRSSWLLVALLTIGRPARSSCSP
jgi:hypothetical protein